MVRRRRHSALWPGLVLLLALLCVPPSYAQRLASEFDADIICARPKGSASGTRVDIYTRIPYRMLQFVRSGNGFEAAYSVSAAFYQADEKGRRKRLIETHSWQAETSVDAYAATQSPDRYARTLGSLELPPGWYMAVLRIEDAQTRQAYTREMPVNVRDMGKPLVLSDLVLIENYDAKQNAITPVIGSTVSTNQDALQLFYEVYAGAPQRVRIVREVVRVEKTSPSRSLRSVFGFSADADELGQVTYVRAEPTMLKAGRIPYVVELPVGSLQAGDYRIRVRIENEQGVTLAHAHKTITAEWTGLDEHIRNVDQAVEQLRYIAKDKDLAYIRGGRTPAERLGRLQAFWKKRDPTPGTERNERMEEYYYRITYADRTYGNLAAGGWQSDRGQVLVLFGEPDRIDRHGPRAQEKPYEVWYYTRIGKKFIFVDQEGRGDFKLLTPIWDERNRLR